MSEVDLVLIKNNRQLLADALRSGKYQQTPNQLRVRGDGYCCMGVAQDIFAPGEWGSLVMDYQSYPSEVVTKECLALTGEQINTLVDANDLRNWNFHEIAEMIENMPILAGK